MADLYRHRVHKRFGQNVLHNAGIIDHILYAIRTKQGERLLEIGPGLGAPDRRAGRDQAGQRPGPAAQPVFQKQPVTEWTKPCSMR